MSPIDFTYIIDEDFSPVDRGKVRPSVAQVAILEIRRTVDAYGAEQGTFNASTRPTAEQCGLIIDQAVELTLADLPGFLPDSANPAIQQAVALKAACMVERHFYAEQAEKGSSKAHEDAYDLLLESIESVTGGSEHGERTDSIVLRSTMAEYSPDYSMPPPRIMPRFPLPMDESPDDEGQADN